MPCATSPAPYQTEASLPDLPFAAIDALIRAEAAEQGLALHDGHGRSTWCKLPGGTSSAPGKGRRAASFTSAPMPATDCTNCWKP
ncbi:hypothetical protein [Paracoccus sp. SSK6]|uniref:hypothetical protein n=1 Tax=Paracoccus sp. SSK6 TaxID=3143131 RepID=UPI00321A416D